jgi:histone H3/H4
MAKAKAKKKTTKKATKKAPAKKAEREVLVVASKVKEYIKSLDKQSSADVIPALSEKIYALLDEAVARATENKRTTVRPYDL